ncbi:hypothetical protein [Limnobacter parvus]|uniref:Lipoprotein n=1 Tax=Limnobacter parvus TaxID=2939690 RepID=A0ABT1XFJ6_9BURK|nr:hypothetical protein [Limnobacter parvus]MCR2745368.1 hypothetical protein [Limnobacter parvus]
MMRAAVKWMGFGLALGLLTACNPRTDLSNDNLLKGARAETFILSHGALCARLPSTEAIDQYSRDQIPPNSAVARDVKAWDLSGLLDIMQTRDGRWVIMPSSGLKKLEGVHFRQGPQGDNEALCFGRLWVEKTVDFNENKPFGLDDAVSARFEASLKDAHMINHFKNLKVESFDPSVFTLTTGTAVASTLQPSFVIEMALRPTHTGWYLAKNGAN